MTTRANSMRIQAISLAKSNGGYHFGGSFSCADVLCDLYDHVLSPADKFILSKGHGCWVYYAILIDKGYSPKLEGHPHRDEANGIHCTTGSMGHGLPVAIGIAFTMKRRKTNNRVFVLLGDGECQEGTTWESLLIAKKLNLDNLIVIVDNNKIQGSDFTEDVLPVMPAVKAAAVACDWDLFEIDGHNSDLRNLEYRTNDSPKLVIANTIKGAGVSFMENDPKWHSNWLSDELEALAIEELS